MSDASVTIAFRIPGSWSNPGELLRRLPDGFRLTPEALILPDGGEVEFNPVPPDDQFPQIFRSSSRQPATRDELSVVDSYTVNVCLSGPGGSFPAALTMMQAAAAIIRAGGAGVFIDNSALAHGGGLWLEIIEDGGSDALSFAFAAIIRGREEVWTMGMHVLGLRDLVMSRADADADPNALIEVIRYVAASDKPIEDGHFLGDESNPRFRVEAIRDDKVDEGSPMFNPFGRLKLVSMREIAERN